ncbi:MAG: hypothetical protein ABJG47_03475 [Ekhidna sp.]
MNKSNELIKQELERISQFQELIADCEELFSNMRPLEYQKLNIDWIRDFLERMIQNELEFINDQPDEYVEIYLS